MFHLFTFQRNSSYRLHFYKTCYFDSSWDDHVKMFWTISLCCYLNKFTIFLTVCPLSYSLIMISWKKSHFLTLFHLLSIWNGWRIFNSSSLSSLGRSICLNLLYFCFIFDCFSIIGLSINFGTDGFASSLFLNNIKLVEI